LGKIVDSNDFHSKLKITSNILILKSKTKIKNIFYSVPQSFASAVYATANPSVRVSVRHTQVLCQNKGMQRDAAFIIG